MGTNSYSGCHMSQKEDRVFRDFFGCGIVVVMELWMLLQSNGFLTEEDPAPVHLLWTLMFMKMYGLESDMHTRASVAANTFRLWVWSLIEAISNLENKMVR